MYAKERLTKHFALDEFGQVFWDVKKPTEVMADNRDSFRFFSG